MIQSKGALFDYFYTIVISDRTMFLFERRLNCILLGRGKILEVSHT